MGEAFWGDKTNAEFEGVVDHKVELDDVILAKNMGEDLHKKYPGHLWAINVNSEQGIATIFNLMVSQTHGYLFKLKDLTPYSRATTQKVIMAGGEILERGGLARAMNKGVYAEKVDGAGDKGRKIII